MVPLSFIVAAFDVPNLYHSVIKERICWGEVIIYLGGAMYDGYSAQINPEEMICPNLGYSLEEKAFYFCYIKD